jgi:hypothetical protein
MSNSVTETDPSQEYVTSALTDDEKANIRRFCGYPAYGAGPSGFQGWRFFQAYGLLEYRLGVQADGVTPNLAPAELSILRQYLVALYTLEAAVPGAGVNLDTSSAAVWVHNPNEVLDRTALYDGWCRRLCQFLGLPPGPGLAGGNNSVNLVV